MSVKFDLKRNGKTVGTGILAGTSRDGYPMVSGSNSEQFEISYELQDDLTSGRVKYVNL